MLPVIILMIAVIGSLYAGVATATEAAAGGVLGALIVSKMSGTLNWKNFQASLMGATKTSCMICFILAGASFLSTAMAYTGIPAALAEWVVAMDPHRFILIAALWAVYSIMGCFIDGFSMIVLTTSVVLPIITGAGFDKIWFGIFMVIIIEIAQITPPLGFNLFILQGMTGQEIFSITKAALPFFFLMSFLAALITIFPEIVTWLPSKILSN